MSSANPSYKSVQGAKGRTRPTCCSGRELACVEDSWFTEVVAREPLPEPWAGVDFETDPDWTWHSAAADSGDALRELWADRVNRSRGIVEARLTGSEDTALSQTHPVLYWGDQERVSLRWVL